MGGGRRSVGISTVALQGAEKTKKTLNTFFPNLKLSFKMQKYR